MNELNFFNRLRFKFFHLHWIGVWVNGRLSGYNAWHKGHTFDIGVKPSGYTFKIWRGTTVLAITDFAYTNVNDAKRDCELIAFKSFHVK